MYLALIYPQIPVKTRKIIWTHGLQGFRNTISLVRKRLAEKAGKSGIIRSK